MIDCVPIRHSVALDYCGHGERRPEHQAACRHEWEASIGNRSNNSGCPACASSGFDQSRPGWLYLIRHDEWGLLKVGITNNYDQRIGLHRSRGWEEVDAHGPMAGDVAYDWEQGRILPYVRSRVARMAGRTGPGGRFDGYTESWVETSYPVTSLLELREAVRDGECGELPAA